MCLLTDIVSFLMMSVFLYVLIYQDKNEKEQKIENMRYEKSFKSRINKK